MPRRGRPPLGPDVVKNYDAPKIAEDRLHGILNVIANRETVDDACQRLQLSRPRFYQLKQAVIDAGFEALMPKPTGRPRKQAADGLPAEFQYRMDLLLKTIEDLQKENAALRVRAEIALTMPEVLKRPRAKKKSRSRKAK